MEIFNGGKGGVICERCRKILYDFCIVRKSRAGRELHYCSEECLILHNANSRKLLESIRRGLKDAAEGRIKKIDLSKL